MTDYIPETDEIISSYKWASTVGDPEARAAEARRWIADRDRKIAAKALRTEAFSGLYGTFAQERLLTRAARIEQGCES